MMSRMKGVHLPHRHTQATPSPAAAPLSKGTPSQGTPSRHQGGTLLHSTSSSSRGTPTHPLSSSRGMATPLHMAPQQATQQAHSSSSSSSGHLRKASLTSSLAETHKGVFVNMGV
jgi:hypothetical protein